MKRVLVVSMMVLASVGMGQNFTDVRSTVSGTGDFRLNDAVFKLTEASITLDQRGSFSLFLKSDRRNFNLTGTWTRTAATTARLSIKGGSIRDARGVADVFLNSDWSLSSANFNGSGTEGGFVGSFRSKAGGGSNPPPIGGILDQTRTGTGTLRYLDDRSRERLNKARVVLTRRGDFEITIYGRSTWRYLGTWRYANDSDVRLTLTDGTGKSKQSGSGIVHSDFRGGFSSIEITGKADGRNFTVDFRADNTGGGGWELFDTVRGEGLINGPKDEDYTLRKASVNLYRNGTFEIVLESNRSHTYYGRWRDGGNQIDLVLTNVSGAGNLVRSGRSVNRFAFTYTESGKSYTVTFQAGR